jgi:hypothetical protein
MRRHVATPYIKYSKSFEARFALITPSFTVEDLLRRTSRSHMLCDSLQHTKCPTGRFGCDCVQLLITLSFFNQTWTKQYFVLTVCAAQLQCLKPRTFETLFLGIGPSSFSLSCSTTLRYGVEVCIVGWLMWLLHGCVFLCWPGSSHVSLIYPW